MSDKDSLDAIDQYLWDASIRLRGISDTRRARVLAEAESHQRARAAELMAAGHSPDAAAALAVAAFGDAKLWSRDILEAAYANGATNLLRRVAAVTGITALLGCAYVACDVSRFLYFPPSATEYATAMTLTCAAISIGAAFRARASSTVLLVLMGLVTAAIVFVSLGVCCVIVSPWDAPYARRDLHWMSQNYAMGIPQPSSDYKLLRLGHDIFRAAASDPAAPLPASLRYHGGYVVPIPFDKQPNGVAVYWESAFKASPRVGAKPDMNIVLHRERIKAATPYLTVSTLPAAEAAWKRDGLPYLTEYSVEISDSRHYADEFASAATNHSFTPEAGWYSARVMLAATFAAVVLNWLAVWMGRRVFDFRQRSRATA